MMRRLHGCAGGGLVLLLAAATARADDLVVSPEAEVAPTAMVFASGACFDSADFRSRVAARTTGLRAPDEGKASLSVAATTELCRPFEQDVYVGRFCGRDSEGHEWTRTVVEADCEAAANALADIAAEFVMNVPMFVPLPEAPKPRESKPRQRSGGFGGTAVATHEEGGNTTGGVRVLAAAHPGKRRAPRMGGTRAIMLSEGRIDRIDSVRAGGLVGWGAPWNDVVPGFVMEAGAMARRRNGLTAEPYVAVSSILQMFAPGRRPLRPIVAFTTAALPFAKGGSRENGLLHSAEAGFVFDAW